MRIAHLFVAGTMAFAATVTGASAASAHVTGGTDKDADTVEIATARLGELTVTARAHRTGTYSASVNLLFEHNHRQWSQHVVGDWMWYPLTGRNGVCRFGVSNQPAHTPVVELSLLQTPATGCSKTLRYTAAG